MKNFKLNIQLFAEPGEPKTFTQEEVDKMIETRLKNLKKLKKNLKDSIMNLLKIMKKESKMLILLQKKSIKKNLKRFKKT